MRKEFACKKICIKKQDLKFINGWLVEWHQIVSILTKNEKFVQIFQISQDKNKKKISQREREREA